MIIFMTLAIRAKLATKDIQQKRMEANSASVPYINVVSNKTDQQPSITTGTQAPWMKAFITKRHVLHIFSSTYDVYLTLSFGL